VEADRAAGVWVRVGLESRGAPVSLVHVCAAAVAGVKVDGAAVTVVVRAGQDTVHASDRVAGEIEEWQQSLGEGPAVDAFAAGGPVLAVDLDSRDSLARWPAFAPMALDSGASAVFALPIQVGAIRLGVLDLYRSRPGMLAPDELSDALAFTEAAGVLLIDGVAGSQPGAAELTWQHEDPTAHQIQVHQATGMIIAQLGTTAEIAYARLRAYAYAHDLRLGDVAREVVERRLRLAPDPLSYDPDPV
jgi:hypothetical protein